MFKEVARAIESGALAEIGLVAFFVAFVLILVRVFTMKKKEREEAKRLPLDDADEVISQTPPHRNGN
jgi:cbb3-type cytochrome oxidase subunit 3